MQVPLPKPRPAQPGAHAAPAAPAQPTEQAAATAAPSPDAAAPLPPAGQPATSTQAAKPEPPKSSPCQVALAAIAVFKPLPPMTGNGKGQCAVEDPVSLEAAILKDGAHVELNPPAKLRCDMAQEVARWLREDVAAEIAPLGAALHGVENYDSYDCRPRNRVAGAKISEHGRGNALDIRALKLASGAVDHLTDPHIDRGVREALRVSACARFHTVLGPGSDGYHESHIHLDLAPRHHDYRICQWDVRVPFDGAEPSAHIDGSREPTPHVSMMHAPQQPRAAAPPSRAKRHHTSERR